MKIIVKLCLWALYIKSFLFILIGFGLSMTAFCWAVESRDMRLLIVPVVYVLCAKWMYKIFSSKIFDRLEIFEND